MEPLKSGIAALLALGLMATPAQAEHSPAEHAAHMAAQTADPHAGHQGHASAQSGAQVAFADVPLLDQEGRELRLKDDLVGDRIVVMGFVYTSCTTVCPVISAILQKLGVESRTQAVIAAAKIEVGQWPQSAAHGS